ncbi:MAG: hypothetical protein ACJ8KF_05010 [Chthoniobacterales bacterium]
MGHLLTTALPKRKDELMPSSNLPPGEQPKVKPFDPVVLDRTVIALEQWNRFNIAT